MEFMVCFSETVRGRSGYWTSDRPPQTVATLDEARAIADAITEGNCACVLDVGGNEVYKVTK